MGLWRRRGRTGPRGVAWCDRAGLLGRRRLCRWRPLAQRSEEFLQEGLALLFQYPSCYGNPMVQFRL